MLECISLHISFLNLLDGQEDNHNFYYTGTIYKWWNSLLADFQIYIFSFYGLFIVWGAHLAMLWADNWLCD